MQATTHSSPTRMSVPGAWLSGALMVILLLALATSLRVANWAAGMDKLTPILLTGFAAGVALSYSRWDGLWPVVVSFLLSLVAVLHWIGQTPDVPLGLSEPERVLHIGVSLWSWLLLLVGEEPVRSNVVFLLQLGILLWWLSYLSAWALFREGRVWRGIIPIGLVLLVNTYFGPTKLNLYFGVFVVCALLLAVRSFLAEQELAWREAGVRYPADIQLDFLRDGFILAVLVIGLAVLLPNAGSNQTLDAALEPVRTPWRDVQQEWTRLFNSLNYQRTAAGDAAFGKSLTLGGPRTLTDRLIMQVKSDEGRYWRAVAYTTFTGSQWLSTAPLAQAIDAANHVQTPQFAARRAVTQTITLDTYTGNVLVAAGQPQRVSLKATADLYVVQPAQTEGGLPLAEIAMLHRRDATLRPGDQYLAVSSLSTATIEDLQEAGSVYPAWVTASYLDLPPDLSPQVVELARTVTAGAATPYDQATALETYLRGFLYNDQINAPPPGVNAVNYFLFESKQGYCDYYASSFAMLARTLGIPARVVAGYSQGDYDQETGRYLVRERHGHSWPEVFFPGYGWIEFEPTASELALVRQHRQDTAAEEIVAPPLDEDTTGPEQAQDLTGGETTQPLPATDNNTSRAPRLLGIALVVAAALAGWAYWRRNKAAQQQGTPSTLDPHLVATLYGHLVQWAHRLRLPVAASQTPHEQAATLAGVVPEGSNAIQTIAQVYVEDRYSPRPMSEEQARRAWAAWQGVLPLLQQAWFNLRVGPAARLRQIIKRGRDQ
ncbi:MAG: transglutaminase domain-containing protein [Caldilineales bacterium]